MKNDKTNYKEDDLHLNIIDQADQFLRSVFQKIYELSMQYDRCCKIAINKFEATSSNEIIMTSDVCFNKSFWFYFFTFFSAKNCHCLIGTVIALLRKKCRKMFCFLYCLVLQR